MECLLCGYEKAHKHGKTTKGVEKYQCPNCGKTFPENLETLYYNLHLNADEVHKILQSHAEGSSIRGISRISGRAYGTVVSLIKDAAQKAQMLHNAEANQVETHQIIADEIWSFVQKNRKTVNPKN